MVLDAIQGSTISSSNFIPRPRQVGRKHKETCQDVIESSIPPSGLTPHFRACLFYYLHSLIVLMAELRALYLQGIYSTTELFLNLSDYVVLEKEWERNLEKE